LVGSELAHGSLFGKRSVVGLVPALATPAVKEQADRNRDQECPRSCCLDASWPKLWIEFHRGQRGHPKWRMLWRRKNEVGKMWWQQDKWGLMSALWSVRVTPKDRLESPVRLMRYSWLSSPNSL